MLSKDFSEFVELLNSAGVEYMLVGGYALAAHGHPRYTGDIDFWVRFSDFSDIGVEDLKANKKASGRAKDLADLESLSTVPRRKK